MSATAAQFLLETRGTQRELDAFVVAAGFDRAGDYRGLRPRRRHAAPGPRRRPKYLAIGGGA